MKQISLTQGQVAIVDDADYDSLIQWKWFAWWSHKNRTFYAARNSPKKNGVRRGMIQMHRQILGLAHDDPRDVDHVEPLATLDNRRTNLRIAIKAQNGQNRRKNRNNTSGYKGVFYHAHTGKWMAIIHANGVRHYLGLYESAESAHAAYVKSAERYHGEFARAG